MFTNCRPNHIGHRENIAAAIFKKRLELLAITLPPCTRIKPHQQTSKRGLHNASSLPSPALAN